MSIGKSVARVFAFFFFLGRRTGKARVFFLMGLIPVVLAVLVRILAHGRSEDVMTVFNDILMVFYLQFYIVILALFYGTSVTAEEIEGRTLPYLITRPLSKTGIVVGKFAAYTLLMFLMVAISLGLAFFIMNSRRLTDPALFQTFFWYAGVLFLGILAYTGLFTFLGTTLKRAILVGLVFGFGWENVIQYFPGSTQKFSVVHYLKSLLPHQYSPGGRFSLLLFRLEPTATLPAILMLALIAGAFVALACWLFRMKEFLFEE
jgi:ABC-type transport system involved in multi-copper enzyme maturation permease subunit